MTDNDLSGHAHSKISSGLNEVTNNDDQTDSERLNSLDTFQNIVRRSITNISHNGIPTEEIVDDDNVDDDDDEAIGYSFFVHRHYEIILPNGQKRAYRLNMLQRVFVMMDVCISSSPLNIVFVLIDMMLFPTVFSGSKILSIGWNLLSIYDGGDIDEHN